MSAVFWRHPSFVWPLVWLGIVVASVSCGSDEPSGPDLDTARDSLAIADSIRVADSLQVVDSLRVADSLRIADSLRTADSLGLPGPLPVPGPDSVDAPDTPPDSLTPPDVPPPSEPPGPIPPRPGIPFGEFHLPTGKFKAPYSGALLPLFKAEDVATKLKPARAAGIRVVIALAVAKNLSSTKGKFDMVKWKRAVDRFRNIDFSSYVADGTVIGHYIIDEPQCGPCWGGKTISHAEIDEIARYSKSIWPNLPTGIRLPPSFADDYRYKHVDFGWAQWEGTLHIPSHQLTAEEFRDREVASAKKGGLGVVFGLNYINGGDGSSGILGDYRNARKVKRFAMSAAEVRKVGAVFAAAPYACAVLSWMHDGEFLARPGMKEALVHVAQVARNRPTRSCKP